MSYDIDSESRIGGVLIPFNITVTRKASDVVDSRPLTPQTVDAEKPRSSPQPLQARVALQ